jgi:hypothetical protein
MLSDAGKDEELVEENSVAIIAGFVHKRVSAWLNGERGCGTLNAG